MDPLSKLLSDIGPAGAPAASSAGTSAAAAAAALHQPSTAVDVELGNPIFQQPLAAATTTSLLAALKQASDVPVAGVATTTTSNPFNHPLAGAKRPLQDPSAAVVLPLPQAHCAQASSGDHNKTTSSSSGRRRSTQQLEVLESVFELCPNPTEARRKQLGQMLNMEERQVVIWFQNKRQRVRSKQKEQEHHTLRQQHAALKVELQKEKARERALEQENSMLKSWMGEKVKKMDDLRKASSELLVQYYRKKGVKDDSELPDGLAEALKIPIKAEGNEGNEGNNQAAVVTESPSPKTPLNMLGSNPSGQGPATQAKEEGGDKTQEEVKSEP
ncbi:homeobox domain-containing protein [Chloropicon primus]|uniref:Homeobox domain-containing protein n=1 Tax=Chloropicon primus TaxID=1764295 RepID=A0A5B8MJ13_9CHLO|nr:hypothetical protein A3770_03p21730 [Chloropicon primus]UPQ98867.1 homeobox domain-containing protein [Chloropicon primus]|mmetsp:Transcript_12263/g.34129  ORF Transcript_12263/g.34129 Transcript_12263/m.34129 type:complete len:329 (+) Transcript_12263:259-1245(+)|eukprot:QDZ19655.1 hypothetical protein A3770_03p21730 [Chloropicon primus]